MRLDDLDPTDNARDWGSGGGGGGGGGLPIIGILFALFGRKLGCGGMLLLGAAAFLYMMVAGDVGPSSTQQSEKSGSAACSTPEKLEACKVMKSTELTWAEIFRRNGKQYQPATINFFEGGVSTGCGSASSAVGPFYCPGDQGVYLDTAFFAELDKRFGAAGDFARAYVVAHEIGHHIQRLLEVPSPQSNEDSVRIELQADCFAGVWAYHNRDRIEPGDVEEGMTAANAIGDDTLQEQAQGRVSPEKFTHGTSAQRKKWLQIGMESGDPGKCDTSGAI